MKAVYAHGDQWRHDDGPVALPTSGDFDTLFASSATTAARSCSTRCGRSSARATFQRIERAWVERYEGQSASTDDFIALASQVSGRNLDRFLRDWVYGTKTPTMPGHPDWTVDPVEEVAPLARPARRDDPGT